MKKFMNAVAVLTVGFLALPLAARADDRKLIEKKPVDRQPASEKEFLIKAIECEVCEVKLADRAIKQSSDKEVTEFARMMRDDHTKTRDALLDRAKSMKLAVVEGLDKDKKAEQDRLFKNEGKDFDREYMRYMVNNHEKALRMYETWAKKSDDKELADIVGRAVPTVKKHLEEARRIFDRVK